MLLDTGSRLRLVRYDDCSLLIGLVGGYRARHSEGESTMKLPVNKTKLVCTIGPASESPEILEQLIRAGMNVARLNFAHGDFVSHKKVIDNIRAALCPWRLR
jgi:hypothetical protein